MIDIDFRLSSSNLLRVDKSMLLNVSIKYFRRSTDNGLNASSLKLISDKTLIESTIFFIFLLSNFILFNTSKLDKFERTLFKFSK